MAPGSPRFFVGHRGHRFASSALMAPMTAAFTAGIDHFIAARGLDLVRFARGQRKDDVTREYLRRAGSHGTGVLDAARPAVERAGTQSTGGRRQTRQCALTR